MGSAGARTCCSAVESGGEVLGDMERDLRQASGSPCCPSGKACAGVGDEGCSSEEATGAGAGAGTDHSDRGANVGLVGNAKSSKGMGGTGRLATKDWRLLAAIVGLAGRPPPWIAARRCCCCCWWSCGDDERERSSTGERGGEVMRGDGGVLLGMSKLGRLLEGKLPGRTCLRRESRLALYWQCQTHGTVTVS